jgi:iron complex transport system ATP-binding protein
MLRCENLTLEVPGRTLVRDLTQGFGAGECWVILGENGAGKSTLLHALGGLRSPHAGRVTHDGEPLAGMGARERARTVGVLLQQEDRGFWGSVLEYVLMGRYPHRPQFFGWQAADEAIARRCLADFDLEGLAPRRFTTLSGGERQRARLAQLFAQAPQTLLLDEPLTHLDLRHQVRALDLLRRAAREQGRTVIAVLHDTWWPGVFGDHVLLLYNNGETAAGETAAMLTRANLERLYRCPLQTIAGSGGARHMPVV